MRNYQKSIICGNQAEFIEMILAMVQNGLTFIAHADTLIIELTGGY